MGQVRGYKTDGVITSVSASTVKRGVASPSDISMNSEKLQEMVGMKFKTFREGLTVTFASEM